MNMACGMMSTSPVPVAWRGVGSSLPKGRYVSAQHLNHAANAVALYSFNPARMRTAHRGRRRREARGGQQVDPSTLRRCRRRCQRLRNPHGGGGGSRRRGQLHDASIISGLSKMRCGHAILGAAVNTHCHDTYDVRSQTPGSYTCENEVLKIIITCSLCSIPCRL